MRQLTSVTARLQDATATKAHQFHEVPYNFQPSLLPVRLTTPGHHLQLTLGRPTPPRNASRPFDTTDDPAERNYQQGRPGRGSARDASQAWFWTPEWQAREREADEDLAAGRLTRHESDEEFLAALRARRLGQADA
jgi:hypothetical protein